MTTCNTSMRTSRSTTAPSRSWSRAPEGGDLRVLGIDPGSRYCGFGVVEDAGGSVVRHVDHGVVAIGDAGPIEARLAALHAALASALDAHRPDVVAIEDVFYARNAR